jgi:SAM-dependent methyltransferase
MTESVVTTLRDHYRELLGQHGDVPMATQISRAGQLFRFRKLLEIADLGGAAVLDLGCGLGEMYPFLHSRFPTARYEGIDIVPEMVAEAGRKYPAVSFRVWDVLETPLDRSYDYVLMSGVFNNAMPEPTDYLERLVARAWEAASKGFGFNFLPTHVNFTQPSMAYHDPARVLDFCLRRLSPRVRLEHHYERCDVAVFDYR